MSEEVPEHGFHQFGVPEMPSYIQGYTKRGNCHEAQTTPSYSQARWGNPRYKGGMDAYVSIVEDGDKFSHLRQKKGNHGVFAMERWAPGTDWRGGHGIASLDALKNTRVFTRGGGLRAGAPRRADVIERTGYWDQTARAGIAHGRYTQLNDNYAGKYADKRRTPIVERESDPLVLRQQIEHNPFHVNSHAAAQAKRMYDAEFPGMVDSTPPGYNPRYT